VRESLSIVPSLDKKIERNLAGLFLSANKKYFSTLSFSQQAADSYLATAHKPLCRKKEEAA
jgi:hypothetical protein